MKKILAVLATLAVAATVMLGVSEQATAIPINNTSTAYDITQATPWSSCVYSVCHVPVVTFTSHFNATGLSPGGWYHAPETVDANEAAFGISAAPGQTVAVISWCYNSYAGLIFDKVDARFTGNPSRAKTLTDSSGRAISGSHLWIGYVPDEYVNLTYADRVNYVPRVAVSVPHQSCT